MILVGHASVVVHKFVLKMKIAENVSIDKERANRPPAMEYQGKLSRHTLGV